MNTAYCPACGANTYLTVVQREGREISECANCGLGLMASTALPYQPLGEILFADDSDLLRVAIEDMLVEKKLARSVVASRDGQEFLTTFTQRLRANKPVDLVMLDVQMPVLNGFNAAVAMRGVEKAFGLPALTPLMFFSSQPCDEKARKVLDFCGRALYVNKVASTNLADLAGRVEQVLVNLLTKGSPA